MSKSKPLDLALDRCLARVQSGEATAEDCLLEYPGLADQLRPLLRTALQTGELLSPPGPTAAYRSAGQERLLNRLRAGKAAERRQPRRLLDRAARRGRIAWPGSRLAWKPAYALAGLLLALALIASGVGVAGAAAEALPGDQLYGVKRGLEEASLVLSVTRSGDADLLLEFAGRRLAEAEALIGAGRQDDLPAALAGYERGLERLLAQAGQDEATLARLEAALGTHQQALERALEQAAPQARPALERALEHSRRGQDQVEEARRGQGPEGVPPGQLRQTPSSEEEQGRRGQKKEKTRTPGPPAEVTRGPKDEDQEP